MKKLLGLLVLVLLSEVMLSACRSNHDDGAPPATPALLANGGTGKTGVGGSGGELYVVSSGSVKILKSGSVDASFTVSAPTPWSAAAPLQCC